ncbi:PilW family protein [Cytobacillus sp. FJAT-54145]|uniref:PilW family protein n=1 Tax=Cytobacillus spartinae TaxID=3299023 RepID=A0ABW6KI72_9BACI
MNKILKNNKGITLIELLVTLAITAIVSTMIYSVFVTGLKLYQKIGIEGQLRDDADYVATMILNQLYENTPNYIEEFNENGAEGLRLVRYESKKVNRYIVEESNVIEAKILIYYKNNTFFIEDELSNEITEISTPSSKLTTLSSEEPSVGIKQCSKEDQNGNCSHGIISLNLVLEDSNARLSSFLKTDPIVLNSTFGF